METITIEVLKTEALNELKQMETEQKIHIISNDKNILTKEEKLERIKALEGSWSHLSYEDLQKELKEMRKEWERNF